MAERLEVNYGTVQHRAIRMAALLLQLRIPETLSPKPCVCGNMRSARQPAKTRPYLCSELGTRLGSGHSRTVLRRQGRSPFQHEDGENDGDDDEGDGDGDGDDDDDDDDDVWD